MKEVFQFLSELKENNEREWFQKNKDRYLHAKAVFEQFVGEAIRGIARFDQDIEGVEVKNTVFRIYRDVRFSPDKRPYKTHMGSFIARGGRMSPRGGYYIHIEPGNALFSGGIWCPDASLLKALRQDVFDNIEEFKSIVTQPDFARYYKVDGEMLKKVPPPFPKDAPGSEWVKYKSYTATNLVPDSFFTEEGAVDRSVERLKLMLPFNRFLNYTVEETMRGDRDIPLFI